MHIRPYLTFRGQCQEAMDLYARAFATKPDQVLRFCDLPANPAFAVPESYKAQVVQATMPIGDDFIRMSDCGPNQPLNDPESERISLAVEADVETIKAAFAVLSEEGRVGMPLSETFYSPCAGVVFDKFGVMWNMVGQK